MKFQDLNIGYHQSKKKTEYTLFSAEEFDFQPGEFVSVIGPNGSGKTTLFKTILGQHEALSGEISIQGQSWKQLSRIEKAKQLSFVPSKFSGVNHLSVYDLIAMGRSPHTNMLNQLMDYDHEVIQNIVDQLDLKKLVHKNTVHLSDGERQVAMIGKALAQEAKIMILDEPTAFLDYNNRRKVLEILKELARSNNQLIFISSHDLDLCFDYCNRVVGIDAEQKTLLDYKAPFDRRAIIQKVFK